jgi:non-heme chloroperoxidase
MFIQARDGINLRVKDMGTGDPVILIHGWPLTGDMWEHQTLALVEAGYRVITYDRRGFGQSSHPATGYDYDTFANDLADIIKALGVKKAALVGFSMGGGEVARYLGTYGSAHVSRVVLVASVVPYLLKDESHPDGVEGSAFEDMKQGIRADRFGFLQHFARNFYGVGLISRPVSQGVLDWHFTLAIMASPIATLGCVTAFGTTDFRGDLKAFDVPTLVIHGTSDHIVPIDVTGRAVAQALPHAQYVEYPDEPHGLFITAADRLNDDLLGFLAGEAEPRSQVEERRIIEAELLIPPAPVFP